MFAFIMDRRHIFLISSFFRLFVFFSSLLWKIAQFASLQNFNSKLYSFARKMIKIFNDICDGIAITEAPLK